MLSYYQTLNFYFARWEGCCTVPSCDVVNIGVEFSSDILLSADGDCGRAYLWGGANPPYQISDTLLLNYDPPASVIIPPVFFFVYFLSPQIHRNAGLHQDLT